MTTDSPAFKVSLMEVNSSIVSAGSLISTVSLPVTPKLSVTVTIYVPADRPTAVCVVCTGIVDQEYVYGWVPPTG
jgi:hypothetical protein